MNTPSSSLGDSRLLEDALRHDRYAAAASQLGDVQPITRMSAVLALIELADEWLQAVHLTKTQRRRKAQTVIDMLCSYVRSPFPLAAEQKRLLGDAPEDLEQMRRFRAEQADLEAEIQVRERILSEIHDRVRWQLRDGASGFRLRPICSPAPGRVFPTIFRVPRSSTLWILASRRGVRRYRSVGARTVLTQISGRPCMPPMPCLAALSTVSRCVLATPSTAGM